MQLSSSGLLAPDTHKPTGQRGNGHTLASFRRTSGDAAYSRRVSIEKAFWRLPTEPVGGLTDLQTEHPDLTRLRTNLSGRNSSAEDDDELDMLCG